MPELTSVENIDNPMYLDASSHQTRMMECSVEGCETMVLAWRWAPYAICTHHLNENWCYCSWCGEVVSPDERHEVGYDFVCGRCYQNTQLCYNCGDRLHTDDLFEGDDGEWRCGSCHDDYYDDYDDYDYGCDRGESTDRVGGYHSNRYDKLFFDEGEPPVKQLIGFELETQKRAPYRSELNAACRAIADKNPEGLFVFEEDGSVYNGFECISRPMSLRFFRKHNWGKNLLGVLRNLGFRSHNGGACGLHVHMSKEWLGSGETYKENLAKVTYLVEYFWQDIVTLSRRRSDQLSNWAYKKVVSQDFDNHSAREACEAAYRHYNMSTCDAKYNAVHVTSKGTIEFRFPRGTLIEGSFMGCIELVIAITQAAAGKEWDEIIAASNLREALDGYIELPLDEYMSSKGL